MSNWLNRILSTALTVTALAIGPAAVLAQEVEWEETTPLYEDDGWLDITEWLDGNDYNPTDEVAGVWDDEVFDAERVESDTDSDWYGYNQADKADDWYYDYYDDGYAQYDNGDGDGLYEYNYTYYDYDDDAYYDAFTSSYDSDDDGQFDKYTYFRFEPAADETAKSADEATKKATEKQAAQPAKQLEVSGKVEKTKTVKVRSGERLVAQVKSDQGQSVIVDLGPKDAAGKKAQDAQPMAKQGQQITARGPMIKVGDKQVMLAQTVKIADQKELQIDRSGRQISGKIAKLKTSKVRNREHQLAIVDLESDKQILVDFGAADKLDVKLAEGDQVEIRGVPVKVKDKAVFIANSVTKDGDKVRIERTARQTKATNRTE